MTNDERNPNDEIRTGVLAEGFFVISHSGFLRHSSFVVRVSIVCLSMLVRPSTLLGAPASAGHELGLEDSVTLQVKEARASAFKHVNVYAVAGRFGGWPANHGLWSWGDEILVGFSAGYYKDLGPGTHNIDHDQPEEHLLAR